MKIELTNRRSMLKLTLLGLATTLPMTRAIADALSELAGAMVSIEKFTAAGKSTGIVRTAKVVKTDEEWAKFLPEAALKVTRQGGTEAAYTGTYWNSHADGVYQCICCGLPLFDSRQKYESGTGWPSYWQPISALNIRKTSDVTEVANPSESVSCSLCDAHLGRVYGDGPAPSGLRYSINSVALNFKSRA